MPITQEQAQQLDLNNHSQLSPYLESCCLRLSANASYLDAAKEVAYQTGVEVSKSTQHRLVHRQKFIREPLEAEVEEVSVDGGNIRVRTPQGEESVWRGYKAITLNGGQQVEAAFQENRVLIDYVQQQRVTCPLTCLGDGHDGVWNIVAQLTEPAQRREILDWYHLNENLYKVDASREDLKKAEAFLWEGHVDAVLTLFGNSQREQTQKFCAYLEKHRHRVVNYSYYQAEQICSIGSGAVESAIKRIDRRTQISGAQWKTEYVPQVLAHRCAYLNNLISV